MDDTAVDAVKVLKELPPRNIGEVRHVLGLLGYHRRHIQDYARLAKPLSDLLVTDKDEKATKDQQKKLFTPAKSPIKWTDTHQQSLETLIHMITEPPILAYPDYEEEFFIHTDASALGLGAILYQRQNGELRVIAYGSRTLQGSEKNYHSTNLNFYH